MNRQKLDNNISAILEKHGAFYAFSADQFKEQSKPGIKYARCGGGLICPTQSADALFADMDKAIDNYHTADLAENGKKAIIWRELANHEAQISMDITSTASALAGYGITIEDIRAEWKGYLQHCIDNDYF